MGEKLRKFKDTFISNKSLTMKEQLGYGAGIFGNCMGQDSTSTYGDVFCRDFLGIKSGRMLIKDNIADILSFIIPPVAGTIYDSPSKKKRSHLSTALFITPIPFALTSMLLFIVPSGNVFFNFLWALFFGLAFSVVDTFYDIAMSALGLRMCDDPKDRKNFFTFVSLASTLGSMLPGWIIPIIVGTTDDKSRQQWLYFFIALVFCILGVTAMYMPYLTVRQKADLALDTLQGRKKKNKTNENETKVQWNKETLSAIFHNRPFIVLQLSLIFDTIRKVTYDTLNYLYKDVFDAYGMKAVIDAISGGLSYAGLFSVPFVGAKMSARNIVAGGYAYTGFMYVIMSLFNFGFGGKNAVKNKLWVEGIRKKKWIVGILIGLAGMPNSAQSAARKIITADSTDYMEWYGYKHFGSAVRSDGILTATENITSKIVKLAKTNIYNGLFLAIDYKEGDPKSNIKTVQTDKTLYGIFLMVTLCGLIGNVLSAVTFLFDNFTGKHRDEILEELYEYRKNDPQRASKEN